MARARGGLERAKLDENQTIAATGGFARPFIDCRGTLPVAGISHL